MDPDSSKPATKKVRSGEDLDILIGFVGFWGLVLFVVTVVREITGQPALIPALSLLVVVLAIWGLVRLRGTLPARTARRHR